MGLRNNFLDKHWNRYGEDIIEPEPLPTFNYKALENGKYVMAAREGEVWFRSGSNSQRLWKSTDHGLTMENTYNFTKMIYNIHFLSDGSMLVATATDSFAGNGDGEVFKSTDGGTTFYKVMDVLSGSPEKWNIDSSPNGTIYLSEYGHKLLPDNARRIYKSTDFGENWTIVYEPPERHDVHMHKLIIDHYNPDTVYQSIGDVGALEIIKTTDGGMTWDIIHTGAHPTSAINFKNHIIWGLDGHPDYGIYHHDKATDTFTHVFKPEEGAGSAYSMMNHNGIIYVGFMKYPHQTQPLSMYVSKDEGYNWEKWESWEIETGLSGRLGLIVNDGVYGYSQASIPVDGVEGSIRFDLI